MKSLARLISNRMVAWSVVVLVAVVSAAAGLQVKNVEHDDDILAFLPRDNPDVEAFYRANELFGSLDLALVGIESRDVFTPDFIRRLRKATKDLKETRGINHVLTLTNVVDFTADTERGGIVTTPLVWRVPKTRAESWVLHEKVMSKEHLVGHLVSEDGKAVLLYCFLAYGADPKTMAGSIRQVIDEVFPDKCFIGWKALFGPDAVQRAGEAFPEHAKYWGGGPFVSTYIYEATQRDIRRLTPWAVLAIVIIMMLAFRDIVGVGLVLLSTALGILISLGLMAFFNVRFNIVLGSMPVILFAVGSAYGIHVLARYYALLEEHDCRTALEKTVGSIGPVVLAAGLTTAAGLLSFICMDIQPLRTFGLFTALGILATLTLSLTFIPAVVCLSRIKRKAKAAAFMRRSTSRLSVFAHTHRIGVGVALAVVCLASATMVSQVRTSMDTASFFSEGSPPDRADEFMRHRFGGSQFIQIHVKGDMGHPEVLRELQRLADRISLRPHVANVLHLGDAVSQANQAFVGQRRIPDTREQVGLLHRLLASDPSVEQLVTRNREQALLHIKVEPSRAEELEALLEDVESIVSEGFVDRYEIVAGDAEDRAQEIGRRRRELALWRIRFLAKTFDVSLEAATVERIKALLDRKPPPADPEEVARLLDRLLRSDECAVDLAQRDEALVSKVCQALVALGPDIDEERVDRALSLALAQEDRSPDENLAEDLLLSVVVPLEEYWREQAARARADWLAGESGLQVPSGAEGERFRKALTMAMLEMGAPEVLLPATQEDEPLTLAARVTGLPVMHRGLSASATSNQLNSLVFALALVVFIMTLYCRSLFGGLLVACPTILTLLVIYGGMGLLGVRLDIGTAMLASLILGAGVDYAVHLTSTWQAGPDEPLRAAAARAADASGPAIWTNAITVCVGFFVLTLGEARPLQNVGGLTAVAMIVAALATFIAIPVLARKKRYRQHDDACLTTNRSETVDSVLKASGH